MEEDDHDTDTAPIRDSITSFEFEPDTPVLMEEEDHNTDAAPIRDSITSSDSEPHTPISMVDEDHNTDAATIQDSITSSDSEHLSPVSVEQGEYNIDSYPKRVLTTFFDIEPDPHVPPVQERGYHIDAVPGRHPTTSFNFRPCNLTTIQKEYGGDPKVDPLLYCDDRIFGYEPPKHVLAKPDKSESANVHHHYLADYPQELFEEITPFRPIPQDVIQKFRRNIGYYDVTIPVLDMDPEELFHVIIPDQPMRQDLRQESSSNTGSSDDNDSLLDETLKELFDDITLDQRMREGLVQESSSNAAGSFDGDNLRPDMSPKESDDIAPVQPIGQDVIQESSISSESFDIDNSALYVDSRELFDDITLDQHMRQGLTQESSRSSASSDSDNSALYVGSNEGFENIEPKEEHYLSDQPLLFESDTCTFLESQAEYMEKALYLMTGIQPKGFQFITVQYNIQVIVLEDLHPYYAAVFPLFIEMAINYLKLNKFMESLDDEEGCMIRALKHGIAYYLQLYSVTVANSINLRTKTICSLYACYSQLAKNLRSLATFIIDKLTFRCRLSNRKGIKFMAIIHKKIRNEPDSQFRLVLIFLFKQLLSHYLRMLYNWIFQGRCTQEFFMNEDFRVFTRDKDFWFNHFKCYKSAVPEFLVGYVGDLVYCGKAIYVLKELCPEHFLFRKFAGEPKLCVPLYDEANRKILMDIFQYKSYVIPHFVDKVLLNTFRNRSKDSYYSRHKVMDQWWDTMKKMLDYKLTDCMPLPYQVNGWIIQNLSEDFAKTNPYMNMNEESNEPCSKSICPFIEENYLFEEGADINSVMNWITKCLMTLVTGEEKETCDKLLFNVSMQQIEHSLSLGIEPQLILANMSIIGYLFDELHLAVHFDVITDYFFLFDGEYATAFSNELAALMYHNEDRIINSKRLNSALARALAKSQKHHPDYKSLLSVKPSSFLNLKNSSWLTAVKDIELHYEIEWPINIIMTSTHASAYKGIFKVLIRIQCSLSLLNMAWMELRSLDKRSNEVTRPLLRIVCSCWHKMRNFSNMMKTCTSALLSAELARFDVVLKERVMDVDLVRQEFSNYVNAMVKICMLGRGSTFIRQYLCDVYRTITKFCMLVMSKKDVFSSRRKRRVAAAVSEFKKIYRHHERAKEIFFYVIKANCTTWNVPYLAYLTKLINLE